MKRTCYYYPMNSPTHQSKAVFSYQYQLDTPLDIQSERKVEEYDRDFIKRMAEACMEEWDVIFM